MSERRYRNRLQEAFFTGEPLDGLGEVEHRGVYPVVHSAPRSAPGPARATRSPKSPVRVVGERERRTR